MKFIKEEPAQEDLFKGQAHTLVAKNVYDSILTDDVFVVGLEGDLGSGKSTILKKVIKLSKDDEKQMHFIDFDTELYHNNNVNKALINILYDELSALPELNTDLKKKKLKSIKDKSLGNVVDYTRTVTSNLSWWLVSFVIAAFCSVEMISDGVKAIGQTWSAISNSNQVFSPTNTVQILFFSASLIWGAIWGIGRLVFANNASKRPPPFGEIFKRQVPERIDEVLEVPNEVGSYELKNALADFVNIIPNENVIILVIDNLDRVPESSLPQVWADLEVFTQIENVKFKLIIPHSTKHVAKAISENNNQVEGMEFISKRIPIKHRVPPLLQSDWRTVLKVYSGDAELKIDEDDLLIIANIIQLWVPDGMLQITPRYLKRQINEIVSILLSQPHIPASIACAYINMTQYGQLTLDEILVNAPEESDDGQSKINHVIARKRTYKQLEKLTTTLNDIKSLFVETHFQADGDIANSELLTSQLDTYLTKSEYDSFTQSGRYGYKEVLLNYLPDADVNYLVDLLVNITDEGSNTQSEWLKSYLKYVSYEINSIDVYKLDKEDTNLEPIYDLLTELETITNNLDELSLDKYSLRKVITKIQNYLKQRLSSETDTGFLGIEIFEAIYKTAKLSDTPIGKRLLKLNITAFIDTYWSEKEKFPLWKDEWHLTEDEQLKVLEIINQFSEMPSPDRLSIILHLKKLCKLGSAIIHNDKYNSIKQVFTSFIPSTINSVGSDIIELYYFTEIYKNKTLAINHQLIRQIEQKHRGKAISLLIVNEINKGTPEALANILPQLNTAQYTTTDYIDHLCDDLVMVSGFEKIIDGLKHTEVKGLINESVKELILQQRVSHLNANKLFNDYYETLSLLFEDKKLDLLNWMSGWWKDSIVSTIDKLSPLLIKDAAELKINKINRTLIGLYESQYESKDWSEALTKPNELDSYEIQGYLACEEQRSKGKKITDTFKTLLNENKLTRESMLSFKLMAKTLPTQSKNTIDLFIGSSFFKENINSLSKELIIDYLSNFNSDLLNINSELNENQQQLICNFINEKLSEETLVWLGSNLTNLDYWSEDNKNTLSTYISGNELNSYFEGISDIFDINNTKEVI